MTDFDLGVCHLAAGGGLTVTHVALLIAHVVSRATRAIVLTICVVQLMLLTRSIAHAARVIAHAVESWSFVNRKCIATTTDD